MLDIIIPASERFDEDRMEFRHIKEHKLRLEHSLISLSKWESKFKKPFLSSNKSAAEVLEYVRFMTLTQNVDPEIYLGLTEDNIKSIQDYIEDSMTATTFKTLPNSGRRSREIITSELIYYWMITFNIPVEFERWHLNRLLTLIEVCARKQQQPKKASRRDLLEQHKAINAANRARFHTKG